ALTEGKPQAVKNTDGGFEKRLADKGLLTGGDHEIHWNFEKFLLDRNGNIVERYFPDVSPKDDRLVAKIRELVKD
ncbi:glutathione peroxidase, partial [bacterium]|nr:glutathione peroxidase [bacterium]